jgi:hypothetical protein
MKEYPATAQSARPIGPPNNMKNDFGALTKCNHRLFTFSATRMIAR